MCRQYGCQAQKQYQGNYGYGPNYQNNFQQGGLGYYNPQDFVTREHFDKTIEELKKLITGPEPVEKDEK